MPGYGDLPVDCCGGGGRGLCGLCGCDELATDVRDADAGDPEADPWPVLRGWLGWPSGGT